MNIKRSFFVKSGFLKPKNIIYSCNENAENIFLNDNFSLLSWNCYKKNLDDNFVKFLKEINLAKKLDICLFQEAKVLKINKFPLNGFCQNFYPNIEMKEKFFGVLSASNSKSIKAESLISDKGELFLPTRKSKLFTRYKLNNGKYLTVVNVHAINFRKLTIYKNEIEKITKKLKNNKDALIIAGDFNCWTKGRQNSINTMFNTLGLDVVKFKENNIIKKFNKYNLDIITFRGLSLEYSQVINCNNISDHNPLLVTFSAKKH